MPPLRLLAYPRYRGYICPSCVANTQAPRRLPWLVRCASTEAGQQDHNAGSRQKTKQADQLKDENLRIRHFNELPEGGIEGADDVLGEDTVKELKSRIATLEADLQKLKIGDFQSHEPSVIDQLVSSGNISLPNRPKAQISSLGHPLSASFAKLAFQNIKIPLGQFPQNRRKNISKLNQALNNFTAQPSSSANAKELWKWYSHCRSNLSSSWHLVPSGVWTVLWDAFSRGGTNSSNRMAHIRRLGEDIQVAGAQLDRPQTLLYVESVFMEGNRKKAINQWEKAQTELAYEPSTATNYWALGVRMLGTDGQAARAEQATDLLINGLDGESNHRILISIIRYWLESGDQAAVQRAWAVYVRLKYLLGTNMGMSDYDGVAGAFLAAEQTDLALAVFRDMMLTGDPSGYGHDSVSLYQTTFRTVKDLKSFKLAPAELEWTSHEVFTLLKKKQQNKYFYGSWIKKLIGEGQIDWAEQVVGLMYRRNIIPDPRHMNGLIGAWIRSGTPVNQQKAEDLAWKMISARLKFVNGREQHGLEHPLQPVMTAEKKSWIRPSRFAQVSTIATVETFCILINYYQRRRRGDRVQEIITAIKAAKIKPNTSFLNDLLLVGAMQNRQYWTWNAYIQLLREDGVKPDQDTFAILWQMTKDHLEGKSNVEFPSPRVLFAEITHWSPIMKQNALARELYELILECFNLADDQIGALVAGQAMQQLFGLYPNEKTIAHVIVQLAKCGNRKVATELLRRRERDQDLQHRVTSLTGAFRQLEQERLRMLSEQGINMDDTEYTKMSEELLIVLGNLLRFATTSKLVHPVTARSEDGHAGLGVQSSIQHLITCAADDMGVPRCVPKTSSLLAASH